MKNLLEGGMRFAFPPYMVNFSGQWPLIKIKSRAKNGKRLLSRVYYNIVSIYGLRNSYWEFSRRTMTPQRLRQLFSKLPPLKSSLGRGIPAAVLIPLFYEGPELMMLFTQRTYLVKHHRGQISFPGGVHDSTDDNLLTTALRESQEEIGLAPEKVDILGFLNSTLTITGFLVHSFVGLIPYPYEFRLNVREVARLLSFPVRELLRPHRWRTGPHEWEGKRTTVYYCQMPETTIWGATARILVDFLAVLDPSFEPAAIPEATFRITS